MKRLAASGFTLTELLIVVAIIAVLAAIATPNFLEAQMRSKVSRAQADMRTLQTALEAYAVDWNSYPLNAGGIGLSGALLNLTKPRAYIGELPRDIFQQSATYFYLAGGHVAPSQLYGGYALASAGPNLKIETTLAGTIVYDPTNGSASDGDILATQSGLPK
jgi:type II secretion system protein G